MTDNGRSTRLATSLDGQSWDNQALVEELRSASDVPEGGHWSVWNWHHTDPPPSPLEVVIAVPNDTRSASAMHEFLDAVGRQLKRAFGLFCSERGWPPCSYRLRPTTSNDGEWSYAISLPGGPKAEGRLKPAKLLLMGDEKQLSPLLGLETVDPILGLPAKWIARSQLGAAHSAQLHLFDGPGLVAAHSLHLIGELWHRTFGFLEVQHWMLAALPSHTQLLTAVLPRQAGLFLQTVKDMVADHLWLPHPGVFLELFAAALPELDHQELDGNLLRELMRKDIVPLNLGRFVDGDGTLHAVEWKGEPEGDDADQSRLLNRLGAALLDSHDHHGAPVVLTDFESRLALSQVLRGPFPYLPVLSWAELPAHARLNVVAVIDARFDVDPTPWRYATFKTTMP